MQRTGCMQRQGPRAAVGSMVLPLCTGLDLTFAQAPAGKTESRGLTPGLWTLAGSTQPWTGRVYCGKRTQSAAGVVDTPVPWLQVEFAPALLGMELHEAQRPTEAAVA